MNSSPLQALKRDYVQNGTHHSGMWGYLIENSSFYGRVGARRAPLHFSSKDFEILDLDPPNNPTSHYDACHFGFNLALKII